VFFGSVWPEMEKVADKKKKKKKKKKAWVI
jgi:hypothetical protein